MVQTRIVQGSADAAPLVCTDPRRDKWRARWDFRENADGGATYTEAAFDHRPTPAELRAAVSAHVNAETEEAIRSGFTYEGATVWLSQENQMNYKAAYDLAVQTDGASLPVTFKLGTDEVPVYRTFTTLAELRDFYTAAHRHVQDCLAKGWEKKDAVKWEEYE